MTTSSDLKTTDVESIIRLARRFGFIKIDEKGFIKDIPSQAIFKNPNDPKKILYRFDAVGWINTRTRELFINQD